MTEAEILMAAMDRLTATVETLEWLKNLSMVEWLVSAKDAQPEIATAGSDRSVPSPTTGHG